MSTKRALARIATAVATLALIVGTPQTSVGQVTKKPVPRDTVVKPQASPRIKITKENTSGGEVVPVPVVCETLTVNVPLIDFARDDSIRRNQYWLDSTATSFDLARMRSEMMRSVTDAEARVRAEWAASNERAAIALKQSLVRGFYLGIAGGTSAPQRALRDGYTGGYNVTVPVGYDATDMPLGIRIDGSVDHMNGTRLHNLFNETVAASGDITVWSLNTDLKLRLPLAAEKSRSHLYALGGIGVHKVTGGVYGTGSDNAGENLGFNHTSAKFGWNLGAGAAMAWGPAEVFIESRFMQVKSDLPYRTAGGVGTYSAFTPIVIGVQWF
jgi:opacity protein-like surface antigen